MKNYYLRFFFLGWLSIILIACVSDHEHYAPVTDISTIEPLPKKGTYRISADETLYSIAWRYGLDYRYLAKLNHISAPYAIQTGQILYLKPNHANISAKSITTETQPRRHLLIQQSAPPSEPNQQPPTSEREPTESVSYWQQPAHGPILDHFSSRNKGINIGGHIGDAIYATASGKVVYSGHGLRGYGNLIIIKHNSSFLTAYAHNSAIIVKEGQWVKAGQKIAEMGNTGTRRTMLHFEIRRHGQPVNPLIYLNKKV